MASESLRGLLLGASIVLALSLVPVDDRRGHAGSEGVSVETWQYPVRLGDSRAGVHRLLGAASRTTAQIEEYPSSGVTVWFDNEGMVTKLNFAGEASTLYESDSIVSERPVAFALTGRTDEAGFRRVLGAPKTERQQRSTEMKELQCVWKKDGYVVDALFLVAERSHEGKTYRKGSLIWFEISRGL